MKTETPAGTLTELLRAVAGGDADALAAVYRLVESPVYAFALSRLDDREQAAEVLHEVMLEVWRRASGFEKRSRPLTWILGIAHHKIVDALRRGGRWKAKLRLAEETTEPTVPSPAERFDRNERRAIVRQALTTLSDAHRQVVYLAFYEDLSYPEIALLLNIPEGTVKTRMFHARKALRRQLDESLMGGAA